ncbi:MAG: hypothetical protein HKN21_15820, partial [Candidatus Eisenbacteria bacterium]|nr:hypothetical protein [Candidatus Eisenbacteria bacterium]
MQSRFSNLALRGLVSSFLLSLTLGIYGCSGGGESQGQEASSKADLTELAKVLTREDPHPRPEGARVYEDAKGVYGGRYVSTVRIDPKTWNTIMANEASSTTFTSGILYESLVGFDNYTQERKAVQAERWELSEDGKTWTFYLRKGLRWSDGAPLTADDVIFTSQLVYDEEIHPSVAELAKAGGENYKYNKIDDHTVQISTAEPVANFLNVVGSIYTMPKHILEESFKNGTFSSVYGVDT